MKKLIKLMMVLGTIGLFFPACDLDKTPHNAMSTEDTFQTMTDANFQRNGLYSQFRGRQLGVFASTAEWMTDLFIAAPNFGNRGGNPHFLNTQLLDDYFGRDIWRNVYNSIAQINNFIERIGNVETTTAAEKASIDIFIAEAHYMRAYMYYILIKYFGVAYDPATAASKPGVPLVTTVDIQAKPARASVAAVYGFIMDEIALAEKLTVTGAAGSERITIDAVRALKSRVQLLMRNYAGAAATAQGLIDSGRYALITTEAGLRNYWTQDVGSEDILRLFVSATEFGVAMVGAGNANDDQHMAPFASWSTGNSAYWPDWLPTKTVMDMYEATDLRKSTYFIYGDSLNPIIVRSAFCRNVYTLGKFPFTTMYGGATAGAMHRHKPKVHRIAEQYLIAAEALHRSGNTAAGLAVMNTLRAARGASALNALTDEAIRNEWAKEMIGEGVYLSHMKRWGIGFNGRVPQEVWNRAGTARVDPAFTGADLVVAPANWYRFTLPIPQNDLRLNPNLEQTPEWVDPK